MKTPTQKMRRMYFDSDADQDCFRAMWNALALCEPNQQDIRLLFIQARLFAKLEKFSVPAPDGVPTLNLRRQRMLPDYPGHPISLDLLPQEMSLIEVCLQLVPWGDYTQAKMAADALEFMLKSELVDVPVALEDDRTGAMRIVV